MKKVEKLRGVMVGIENSVSVIGHRVVNLRGYSGMHVGIER